MTAGALRIPITNVRSGGDYTAQIKVGSSGAPANVILDTGSSSLAVTTNAYDPNADTSKELTPLAQDIAYGEGGWTGPVIKTSISIGTGEQEISAKTNLAVTVEDKPACFGNSDGILGLAFNSLNRAYNLSAYLGDRGINPPDTYPWPFMMQGSSVATRQFTKLLSRLPEEDLPPYFTVLESQGITKNIFAFYTLRSAVAMGAEDPATDPVNSGYFILGGGQEQGGLYKGNFIDVDVVDDMWYNTELHGVQVAGGEQIDAKPLSPQDAKSWVSNSIIDSGTNHLLLAQDVYAAILSSLNEVNPQFAQTIQQAGKERVVPASSLHLDEWPDITFIMKGKTGENEPLTCVPSTYWQMDAPKAGQALFQICSSTAVQSVLGLPLLNNYFTVFDRTQDPYGVVRFAPIAAQP